MGRDLHFPTMVGGVNCHKEARSAGTAKEETLIYRREKLRRGAVHRPPADRAARRADQREERGGARIAVLGSPCR